MNAGGNYNDLTVIGCSYLNKFGYMLETPLYVLTTRGISLI
jgi:hypothetical protein